MSQPPGIIKTAETEKIKVEREVPSAVKTLYENVTVKGTKKGGKLEDGGNAQKNVVHESRTCSISPTEKNEPHNSAQEIKGDTYSEVCKHLSSSCGEYTYMSRDSGRKSRLASWFGTNTSRMFCSIP